MAVLSLAFVLALRPRMGDATRTERDGWTYVRLAGEPYDIGFQYGTLMAKEIDENQKIVRKAVRQSTGQEWAFFRDAAQSTLMPKIDADLLDEMRGQSEALKAKGFAYDLVDVVAFNAYIELEGNYAPWKLKTSTGGQKEACSAFVAVGSATKGGKVVMGQNFWWDYLTGQRFNVMVDIAPKKGRRVMFDALAGFVHSGTDWGMNDAGILITETTISGFVGFDPNGVAEFARMRKALQFSESLDDVAKIFRQGNNGGYANTWLLADVKRKEIGKLQLGLKNVVFSTSNDGAFYGANYPEDDKLRREECPYYRADPNNNCERRRARWKALLTENEGKVDADLAKGFLADDMLDSRSPFGSGTCNTKVATSDSVEGWTVWGRMGFSNGIAMDLSPLRRQQPTIQDVAARPWTKLGDK